MQLELEPIARDVEFVCSMQENALPPANNAGYNDIKDDEDYYYCNYGCLPPNFYRN